MSIVPLKSQVQYDVIAIVVQQIDNGLNFHLILNGKDKILKATR